MMSLNGFMVRLYSCFSISSCSFSLFLFFRLSSFRLEGLERFSFRSFLFAVAFWDFFAFDCLVRLFG
jgi:hypothetical protein